MAVPKSWKRFDCAVPQHLMAPECECLGHPQCLTLARCLKVVEERRDGNCRWLCTPIVEMPRLLLWRAPPNFISMPSCTTREHVYLSRVVEERVGLTVPHPRQLHTFSEEQRKEMLRSRREGRGHSFRRGILSMTSMKSRDVMMNTLPFRWS